MSILQTIGRTGAAVFGRETTVVRRMRPWYESFLNLASGNRGIEWPINDVTYRIDAHYRHQLAKNYDEPVAQFLSENVKPGDVCFDVGANIGVYVLQFSRWNAPNGRVVAFEPNPGAFEVLQRHTKINGLTERAVLEPVAVGAQPGEATLFASGSDGMSRLGAPNTELSGRTTPITVPIVTLDEYCASKGASPDWLFVDVEGFEMGVLSGARRVIAEGRGRLGILVEMHPSVWGTADTTRESAVRIVSELGLEPVPLTGQTRPFDEYGIVHLRYV